MCISRNLSTLGYSSTASASPIRPGRGRETTAMHAPALAKTVDEGRCTNCGAGWTDYGGAFAGLLGAVLAGVALWLTNPSAAEARASREAAEQSAEAATRTAEASEAQLEVVRNE